MSQPILLVDDDRWWAEHYQTVLEKAGYECIVATNVTDALNLLDSSPQAIVLDFMLPDANALQLLHELQSYDDTHTIPVILCTSLKEAKAHADALEEYGVRVVLDKASITPRGIVKAVKAVIV